MAKLYIFGIGGTGSRVLRSFTMMLASGVKIGADEIVPIIIDPDYSNADLTRTVTLMNNYISVRSQLTFTDDNPSQFFRHELQRTLANFTLRIQDTDDKTFKEFIDLPSMNRNNQAMMRMLFSEKNLSSSMEIGFKGNPNIGSVVLNQIVSSSDFDDFATSFSPGDRIFIISSIFGGTGASGFPLLLKTLREGKTFPNCSLINNAEIGAVTIMPYFRLFQDDNSEIDSTTFMSKTKSALAYYENNISKNQSINSLYYLADDVQSIYENHDGGTAQRNAAHLIEFLAASAIVDFSNNPNTTGVTQNKEFGIKETESAVTFNSLFEADKQLLFPPLTQFVLMSNCLTDKYDFFSSSEFNANNDHFANLYSTSFISHLRSFLREYKRWLRELKSNKRSLNLFNLDCGDRAFDVVSGVTPARVASFLSNYYLVAGRLNASVKKCQSKKMEDKFLEMYFRGTQRLFNEKFKRA